MDISRYPLDVYMRVHAAEINERIKTPDSCSRDHLQSAARIGDDTVEPGEEAQHEQKHPFADAAADVTRDVSKHCRL